MRVFFACHFWIRTSQKCCTRGRRRTRTRWITQGTWIIQRRVSAGHCSSSWGSIINDWRYQVNLRWLNFLLLKVGMFVIVKLFKKKVWIIMLQKLPIITDVESLMYLTLERKTMCGVSICLFFRMRGIRQRRRCCVHLWTCLHRKKTKKFVFWHSYSAFLLFFLISEMYLL